MIRAALIQWLLAQSAVTALVAQRIFPNRAPQKTAYPLVIVQRISGGNIVTLGGVSGTMRPRVQVKCYGLTATDAEAAANAVNGLLNGFKGSMGSLVIQGAFLDNWIDGDEDPVDANDVARHYVLLDYIIWHQ